MNVAWAAIHLMSKDSIDKNAAVAGLAILLGFVGLAIVFSDPVEGWPLRIMIASAFYFFSSATVGYTHPNGWPIAMLTAWGGLLMGGLLIIAAIARYGGAAFAATEPPYISSGLIMLFGSLVLSLSGGYVGKLLSRKLSSI